MNRVGKQGGRWNPAVDRLAAWPVLLTSGSAPFAAEMAVARTAAAAESDALAWAMPLTLLSLLLAALAAVLGAAWMRRRLAAQLREARGERQALATLLDEWQWRSDAEHRLVRMVPPRGAPATQWSGASTAGQLVWERFGHAEADASGLQAALQAQAPLDDLAVERAGPDGRPRAWRLRGRPLFDGEGRFAGYVGTAREAFAAQDTPLETATVTIDGRGPAPALRLVTPPVAMPTSAPMPLGLAPVPTQAGGTPARGAAGPMPAVARDPRDGGELATALDGERQAENVAQAIASAWLPALAQVLDQLPAAAFAGLGAGESWRLSYANPIAQELLGEVGDPPPLDWPALLERLPEPVRAPARGLIADAPPGELRAVETQGWSLGLRTIEARHGVPSVQWLTFTAPTPAAQQAAADAAVSDQEAFSYTVSHDLRAPIRVVEGFTRIIKEDYGRVLDRIGIDHLDRVLSAAARMNNMIDALLDLSRLSSQPLNRQPVNLSQLAGYVIDELRRGSPERQVEVHIQPGLKANGDPTLLRMVLENLLGNAWKYSARTPQASIDFDVGGTEDRPVFCVRDNGAGFDMRFADRLFGIFQRLHSASDFAGTGIGLASVRRIVRRHGGEIWAESEVGHGARFYFTLRG